MRSLLAALLSLCAAVEAVAQGTKTYYVDREKPLSYYMDKGYAIATTGEDSAMVFDAKTGGTPPVVWEWHVHDPQTGLPGDVEIPYFDEVKVRDGGRTLLVTSAHGGWLEVDGDTKKVVRYANPFGAIHSIEKLPDGTIVVARADDYDNQAVKLFWTDENGALQSKFPDASVVDWSNTSFAHGVEWDPYRNCLWFLGNKLMQLGWDSEKRDFAWGRVRVDGGGHDLRVMEDGTIWAAGHQFNPDAYPEDSAVWLGDLPRIMPDAGDSKSYDYDRDYGTIRSTWTTCLWLHTPAGEKLSVTPEGLPGTIYKARWLRSTPTAWNAPLALGETVVSVSIDGETVSAVTHCDVATGKSALLELSLNGIPVTNWMVAASGDYEYSSPVMQGWSNTWSVVAYPITGDGVVSTNVGSFLSRRTDGWFSVDFSSDAQCPSGGDWIAGSSAAGGFGEWSDPGKESAFSAETRTLALCDAKSFAFLPPASQTDEDAEIEVNIEVVPSCNVPPEPSAKIAGICFVDSDGGGAVPHVLCATGWTAMPRGGWRPLDDLDENVVWALLRVDLDFSSPYAPRARYRLDGKTLSNADGEEWVPIESSGGTITALAFRGTGGLGDFGGSRHPSFVEERPDRPDFSASGGVALDGGAGDRSVRMTLGNAVSGGYYAMFVSDSLDGDFVTEADAVRAAQDGGLTLEADASTPCRFAVIAVSPTPIPAGTSLRQWRGGAGLGK
jgi:hypothetical protein